MADETNSYNEDDSSNRRPELSAKPTDKRPIIIGSIAAIIIILLFSGIGYVLFIYPEVTAIIRDIFIIFLGLGALIIILLLIALVVITAYLVLKVNDLVKLLDREIRPPLNKLQETVVTVQGTTNFLSENAVKPVINTASTISAAQTVVRTLFRRN